jgi:hypothetical protein
MKYENILCLEHPVFLNEPMNFTPRERVIVGYQEGNGSRNVFLGFYCHLTRAF